MHLYWKDGSHGHRYRDTIDGDIEVDHCDLRVLVENRKARSNIRDRHGERSWMSSNCFQSGTFYARIRKCTSCKQWKPRKEFRNISILELNRKLNGLNIKCRECNGGKKHTYGYKIDDFIVDG